MTIELTEREILTNFLTESEYAAFATDVYEELLHSEGLKSKDDVIYSIRIYDIGDNLFLHVEASLIKKAKGMHDFGFTRFVITDDIDFSLDRINENKKHAISWGFSTPNKK